MFFHLSNDRAFAWFLLRLLKRGDVSRFFRACLDAAIEFKIWI